MHQGGGVRLFAIVEHVECLLGQLAAMHVVKLYIVGAQVNISYLVRIVCRNVCAFGHRHLAANGHVIRPLHIVGGLLLASLGEARRDGHVLVEMSQEFRVITQGNRARRTGVNGRCCPPRVGAAAIGVNIGDDERARALVGQREHGLARRVPEQRAEFLPRAWSELHLRLCIYI